MKRILFVTFIAVITLVFSCTPLTKEKQDLNLQKDSIKKADSIAKIYSDSVVKANYSGIWMIESYVDDFGAPTKKKYITNSDVINGKFSNSATTNSELNVKIIIESQNVIDIKLFEYAGKNPVKTCVEEGYKIRVKSKTGDFH